jgi:HEAT repeat protein
MSKLIWTYEDYCRFAKHSKDNIRRWAFDRLQKLYGTEAKDVIADMIQDKVERIACQVPQFLAKIGAIEYAFPIHKRFLASEGVMAGNCAQALGQMKYTEAVPHFIDRLKTVEDSNEFLGMVDALGAIQTGQAKQALLDLLRQHKDELFWANIVRALLKFDDMSDIPQIVNIYMTRAPEAQFNDRIISAFEQDATTRNIQWVVDQINISVEKTKRFFKKLEEEVDFQIIDVLSNDFLLALANHLKAKKYGDVAQLIFNTAKTIAINKPPDISTEAGDIKGQPPALSPSPFQRGAGGLLSKGVRGLYDKGDGISDKLSPRIAKSLAFLNAFAQNAKRNATKVYWNRYDDERINNDVLFLIKCLLTVIEDYREKIITDEVKNDLSALMRILAEDRKEIPDEVTELVAKFGEKAVDPLIKVLEEDSWGSVRAAEALGIIAAPKAIPALLAAISQDKGDFLCEAAGNALTMIGEPVLSYADDILKHGDSSQKIYLLGTLSDIPLEKTVDIILENIDQLLKEMSAEPVLSALHDLGSHKAIEPIKKEIHKGDLYADEVFLLLCDLAEREFPELNEIRQAIAENEQIVSRRTEAMKTGDIEELMSDNILLDLKCRQCGRINKFRVKEVYSDPELKGDRAQEDSIFFKEKFVCKYCGTEEDFEYTGMSCVALIAEMLKLNILSEQEDLETAQEMSPLKIISFALKDGTRMNPKNAIKHYTKLIEKEPDNAELHARLGNIYRFLEWYEDAIAQHQRAIELDEEMTESYLTLGHLYLRQEDYDRAKPMFAKVLSLGKSKLEAPNLYPPIRLSAQEGLRMANQRINGKTRTLIDFQACGRPTIKPSKANITPKVGRNDPCPCGSGKKYKKCCGR